MPLGLYVSVPFCRTKCTYCNFSSDVFSKALFKPYVDRLCRDLERAQQTAEEMGGLFEADVDTIYLGGGTPTVLDQSQLNQLFVAVSQNFAVLPGAEITVECAPGTLSPALVDVLAQFGVNRVSLGVQSFVDQEAAWVGRLHKLETVIDDISRLRSAGIIDINLDLIAGMPGQTEQSWDFSLDHAILTQAPHLSVYMLEVDEDSRLGRELIAGGTRYHAHFVPQEDLTADFYIAACERLELAGVRQYEISNFARSGHESQHNLKYWRRQPYMGFGVDAHSMLRANSDAGTRDLCAVRFSTADSLHPYLSGERLTRTLVNEQATLEETFFLGLRLTSGVDLAAVSARFGHHRLAQLQPAIREMLDAGLLQQHENLLRLTARGRLLSNEVFERFLSASVT
jgi:oxygen-independent coproporphyrinogen III oxidase